MLSGFNAPPVSPRSSFTVLFEMHQSLNACYVHGDDASMVLLILISVIMFPYMGGRLAGNRRGKTTRIPKMGGGRFLWTTNMVEFGVIRVYCRV